MKYLIIFLDLVPRNFKSILRSLYTLMMPEATTCALAVIYRAPEKIGKF